MTVTEVNKIKDLSSAESTSEQLELLALARCMNNYIERHGEQNQSFDVLKALATLTIERIEQGKTELQCTALNILTAANIPTPDGKGAGTKLSPIWNKLNGVILEKRRKGIQDFARNEGLKFYPWPDKDGTEGGRPSLYYLKGLPLPENEVCDVEPLAVGELAYIREITPEPSWWAKPLLRNGYRLEGWRRWLFLTYGVGSLLFAGCALILLWNLLWRLPTWSIKDISTTVLASAFFIFAFWLALNPFFRLLEWRIVMAPTGLVALNELHVQMEVVRELPLTASSPGIIRLVRYASTCPQCRARVELEDGRKEFPNRLVGRCRENPGEHVYSFDRFTCRGRSVR